MFRISSKKTALIGDALSISEDDCFVSDPHPDPLDPVGRGVIPLEDGRAQCLTCKRVFAVIRSARRHVITVHAHSTVNCPHCERPYKNEIALRLHIKRAHQALQISSTDFQG